MRGENSKYRSIFEALRREIENGKYGNGRPFPSETALMRRFGVARHTVLRALWELRAEGYVTRRQGKGTFLTRKSARTKRIALIVHGSDYCEIFAPIMREVSHICHENGCLLLLGDINGKSPHARKDSVQKLAQAYLDQGVAGVIFQPIELLADSRRINAGICSMFDAAGVPVVLLDSDIVPAPERSAYDIVGIDHFAAGRRMAAHLRETGARRIAYLMQANRAPCVLERWRGLQFGCFGLPLAGEPLLARPDDIPAVRAFLRRHRPDAIACYNDIQAGALMRTLAALKRKVPADIAVSGFDDVNCATLVSPSLTTTHQPCAEIARTAVETLLARIANPALPPREVFLSAPLVVRESTVRKT